ncbi:MAG: DUF4126 domain-containing protein [Planktothrix sp.]
MGTLFSICIGICLSAACGFRIFVPLLVMSMAAQAGHLNLPTNLEWVGTTSALVAFAVATFLEIAAYYIPWVDNLLDTMATPAAIVAGTLVTASFATEMSPQLQWTVAVIAGGGSAGSIQALTGVTRLASTATTGGLGNPLVSTMEAISSTILSVLAILLPTLAMILLLWLLWFAMNKVGRKLGF